jgi:hypothetical protein
MSTQEERGRRIGLNEALFRRVNNEIEEAFAEDRTEVDVLTILCECGDLDCTMQVRIAPKDYRRVRADPVLFVITPGHDAPDVETIVERDDAFDVVRKAPGEPERIARSSAY